MAKVYAPTKLSENISKTPEGYLLCKNVPIARTGTMEYGEGETPLEVGDDGKILIDRDPEEVFDKKTIASFEGKSVTIKHPEEFVNPKNWAALSKGILRNVRKSDEKDENGEECLLADLLITDSFAITLVESGLREVSCGYEAEYEQTGKGKGRQSNIVGNHLALVEESRAGSSYAINDHKGKDIIPMKTFKELKDKLAELVKVVDAATKDGEGAVEAKVSKKAGSETNKVFDEESMDELVKAVKDLSDKVDGMMKPKDEKEHEEEESEDEGDMEAQILERVKALEAAMAKMLEGKSKDDDEEEESEDDDEEEESEDDDEEEESEDDDEEEKEKPKKTGDAARAEILAPGIKVSKKNLKVEALKAAYKTNEGKAVINILTGGKKPTYDSAEKVSTLFLAASELLKTKRKNELEKTKDGSSFESFDHKNETMTAEKMNELNEKHWASINKGK